MAKINILIVLFINLLLANTTYGQYNANKIFSFLELPVSAKAAAFNGHTVSQANPDLLSAIANPAYLDSSFIHSIQVSYYSHFSDASISSVAYAYQLKNIGLLAASVRFLNYGAFTKYNELGFEQGSFSSYDVALTTSLTRPLFTNLTVGGAVTLVRSSIDTYASHGLLFTLGSYYRIPSELTTIGFTIRDIGFQLNSFDAKSESIPFDISLGLTKKLQYVPFRFTLTLHSLQQWPLKTIYDSKEPDFSTDLFRHAAFGGEFLLTENFNLRFGFNKYKADAIVTDDRLDFSGTSFGAGFKISKYYIDLTRASFSSVGAHYQLSISTKF